MNTERLMIRKFVKEDLEDLYDYLSNPDVVIYEPYEAFTKEQCEMELKERLDEKSPFWAVCLKETNQLIGHLFFCQIEHPDFKTWLMGYVFNPKYSGKGYATESAKAMIKYAFEDLKAHRVVSYCHVHNEKSWKLLERLSMRREAHMLQNVFFKYTKDGQPIWHDSYQYAILSSEWQGYK